MLSLKLIWKAKIPYKISFFTWILDKEAVLTQDNLNLKRVTTILDATRMEKRQRQTINHFSLHYKLTLQLFKVFINLRDIMWTMPRRIPEVLACWNRDGNLIREMEDCPRLHLVDSF